MADRKTMNLSGFKGATIVADISNIGGKPYYIQVRDTNDNRLLFERVAEKKRLHINIPRHGDKISLILVGSPAKISQTLAGKLVAPQIPFDRNHQTRRPYKISDIKLIANPNLPSPARMFTKLPIIEFNPSLFKKNSEAVGTFVIYHEVGHQFFDDEKLADRWAITQFLNDGYNMSSANYGLTQVLQKSPGNVSRMIAGDKYLREIQETYYKTAAA